MQWVKKLRNSQIASLYNMHFIKKRKASLLVTAIVLLILVYPWLVILLNPPPVPDALKRVEVKVQKISDTSPNLSATLADGTEMNFDLPPSGYALVQGFPRSSFLSERRKELESCSGSIEYDKMRFMPFKKTSRIWVVNCGPVKISFENSLDRFEKNKSGGSWINAIALVFGLLLCSMIYYAEGLKK